MNGDQKWTLWLVLLFAYSMITLPWYQGYVAGWHVSYLLLLLQFVIYIFVFWAFADYRLQKEE